LPQDRPTTVRCDQRKLISLKYRFGFCRKFSGVEVDHSTLNRWVLKYVPALEKAFLARKRPVGRSWRLDETYVRVKGAWKYLYRAVDKAGATVDFLLTARRDRKAALRFLRKAIGRIPAPFRAQKFPGTASWTTSDDQGKAGAGADISCQPPPSAL
jgi:transposase-like protein